MLFAAKLAGIAPHMEIWVRQASQKEEIQRMGIRLREGIRREDHESASDNEFISAALRVEIFGQDNDNRDRVQITDRADPHFMILAVKQSAFTPSFVDELARLTDSSSWIVCLQNGIGHVESLASRIPLNRILLAVTTEGAWKQSNTEVVHTGQGTTWIGAADPLSASESETAQKKLAELFQLAGFHTLLSKNIISRVWQKLLINAVINPLSAILHVKNGELPHLPHAFSLMRVLFEEGADLAAALNIDLEPDLWDQLMEVCRKTAANQSSMLQDMLAGRLTEIDAITGGLLHRAEHLGIALPAHQTVYRLVKSMEQCRKAMERS